MNPGTPSIEIERLHSNRCDRRREEILALCAGNLGEDSLQHAEGYAEKHQGDREFDWHGYGVVVSIGVIDFFARLHRINCGRACGKEKNHEPFPGVSLGVVQNDLKGDA
ncbi:MAG: hypothetical protein ACLT98_13365 [Eggerthellaceae bacterium]